MRTVYRDNDYAWVRELMRYPETLASWLGDLRSTTDAALPDDPIDRVVFQEKAKKAIRKIAYHRGHVLMVGKPGTGKSMLANMLQELLDASYGDELRPRSAILAYPGKDRNHIRIAYESPGQVDAVLEGLRRELDRATEGVNEFSLEEPIRSVRRMKHLLLGMTALMAGAGFFLTPLFAVAGVTGIGSIFLFLQENNHRAQETIQRQNGGGAPSLKSISDLIPEVLFDPRRENRLMARVSEPNARNMKGGFRHDPYQSGNLHTPAHQRAYLGAHATAPVIFIDELKTLIKRGYMPELLEIMQNKKYILEGGKSMGSGASDRSENELHADNIIVACCNHDTIQYLQQEGEGAFLSRIEDKGEIITMESSVPETRLAVNQVVRYIKQEIVNIGRELDEAWGEVRHHEGREAIRKRCESIFGKPLPEEFEIKARDFSRSAVMEIVKELRCRSADRKLSSILRPINGIIKAAEFEAMVSHAPLVEDRHVRAALTEHLSLEGALSEEFTRHKRDLKKYIDSMTDAVGYVVGLSVVYSDASGRMTGQPLPIHCQIDAHPSDRIVAGGKLGDIAKAAAQNVRASIKRVFNRIGAPFVGYEMHIEYIQAHGGVEGDSASAAIAAALVSDFIRQPVTQKFGVTGSLTGEIILAVGGVSEKLRSIMDPGLGMTGACVPWQNKHDIEPLLINAETEYIQVDDVPGIRIHREADGRLPFDIHFCKTKYCVFRILMGLSREEIQERMAERCRRDLETIERVKRGDLTGGRAKS
ncbi:MAG: S16 family serine protease [Desulfobacterales bacterium]